MTPQGALEYREADVRSMPREKLVVLLYEKMMRDLERATEAHVAADHAVSVDRVSHSLQILTELLQAVDPAHDTALAENLAALYEYMIHRHHRYLADRNPDHLEDCRKILSPLMEAWREAAGAVEPHSETERHKGESASGLFSVSA